MPATPLCITRQTTHTLAERLLIIATHAQETHKSGADKGAGSPLLHQVTPGVQPPHLREDTLEGLVQQH